MRRVWEPRPCNCFRSFSIKICNGPGTPVADLLPWMGTEGWRDYTVILDIAEPMQLPSEDKMVYDIVDSFLAEGASVRLSTVINTIFPATLFARHEPRPSGA